MKNLTLIALLALCVSCSQTQNKKSNVESYKGLFPKLGECKGKSNKTLSQMGVLVMGEGLEKLSLEAYKEKVNSREDEIFRMIEADFTKNKEVCNCFNKTMLPISKIEEQLSYEESIEIEEWVQDYSQSSGDQMLFLMLPFIISECNY